MSDSTTSQYDGTLERTADGGVIRFERHLDYSIRDVWDAITKPERLAEWWLPFDEALHNELRRGLQAIESGETGAGAARFTSGEGRHGETVSPGREV